jgi:alanyl-tRNA synthetase
MTSTEIRQSFLDFFEKKCAHTIVPSSSLMPDAPNLLFTNAGMNRFVPIFLGQVKCPYSPARAADTQKCIRAGGKHNDLEDVGLDTYHHTFFEMLGNWSFGDYFKREAIDWAWELLVNVWKFPKERMYATYFGGDDKIPADNEARELWLRYLPANHIVAGNRKDNFWMMGDTGPCGPCSEIHIDLTPAGDTNGRLVNAGNPLCIEIWNLVFIQFNANADGSLTPLPAKHVDTGMGFERVSGMMQCTNGFRDFSRMVSNYESDVFTPIFRVIEQLSGQKYGSTLPGMDRGAHAPAHATDRAHAVGEGANADTRGRACSPDQIKIDIAFRVIADHIRCLSFAVADGIIPSNEGRGYVLRRILRRAVRYGRNLGFHEPFFFKLVDVVVENFGAVFPEVRRSQQKVKAVLQSEEESFNRTLDRGIELFEEVLIGLTTKTFPAADAFKLYDTSGFPLDLTELMARERGLTVDVEGFERLMEEQRTRARLDHQKKKETIAIVEEGLKVEPTKFLGYDTLESEAVVEAVNVGEKTIEIVLDQTPFYAEMGGQVGDTGLVHVPGHDRTELGRLKVVDTQRQGEVHVHRAVLVDGRAPEVGEGVRVSVDAGRRANIQRHHTVTHLFDWALHEVVSRDALQRGSLVAPDRMRFDFNCCQKLTDQQISDIERLVNDRIKENAPVHWFEVPYIEIRNNKDVIQVFGEKYGETVRVIQIGGHAGKLDGFSMELCGGTHTKATGEIGLFKIARESAIAAGIRRVEAMCGQFALEFIEKQKGQQAAEAEREKVREQEKALAKQREAELQARAPQIAEQLLGKKSGNLIVENLGDVSADFLRAVVNALKPKFKTGVVVLAGVADGKVSLICSVTPDLVAQGKHAGKIVGELAKLCGGGGGGKPDLAQAGGKDPSNLGEALAKAANLVG